MARHAISPLRTPLAAALTLALGLPTPAAAEDPEPKPLPKAQVGSADRQPPSPLADSLVVVLAEKRPLRLVALVTEEGRVLDQGLDGALEVRVENTAGHTVVVAALEVHGLVFTDRKTGRVHVVVHPCKCARDGVEPESSRLPLPAGARHSFVIDDWGCGGGMWRAPPPGDYEVRYRLQGHPVPPYAPGKAFDPKSAPKMARACRQALNRAAWWAGAAVSAPIRVRLGEPVRRPVDE